VPWLFPQSLPCVPYDLKLVLSSPLGNDRDAWRLRGYDKAKLMIVESMKLIDTDSKALHSEV
jgi:hypothetical protein